MALWGANLPFDIFYSIFDVLGLDKDLSSLKSCSLTHRCFRPLCQRHIFSAVAFVPQDPHSYTGMDDVITALESFAHIVHDNPILATYVKVLDLCFHPDEADDPIIPFVLERLPSVEDLTLRPIIGAIYWKRLDDPLRSSLERSIASPHLRRLDITSILRMPICNPLCQSQNLASLVLNQVQEPALGVGPVTNSQIPVLKSLIVSKHSVGTCATLFSQRQLDGTLPVMDFRYLTELRLIIEQPKAEKLAKDIVSRAVQLETLDLEVHHPMSFSGLYQCIRPSSFQTCHTLKIVSWIGSSNCDPFQGLFRELEALPPQNIIRTMDLQVDVESDCLCSTQREHWSAANDVLNPSHFPSLQEVSIGVEIARFDGILKELGEDTLAADLNALWQDYFSGLQAHYGDQFRFKVWTYNY